MIFDTHAHYDDEAFDEDRDQLINSLPENGVVKVVNVGASLKMSEASLELSKKYPHVYAAIGIHPDEAKEADEQGLMKIRKMIENPKVVAVGEIGLDYYWNKENKDIQKKAFVDQLDIAKEYKLPVIIHSRDAAEDTMKILKEENAGINGGVVHCFSYSPEIAKEAVKMGFNIGVGGVLTFKNGKKAKEVVEVIPLDRIVIETDCPYLAPVPFRGKRNSSLYLPYVVEMIAEIKNIDKEEVIRETYKNGCRMYGIDCDL